MICTAAMTSRTTAAQSLLQRVDIVGNPHLLHIDFADTDTLHAVEPEIIGVASIVARRNAQLNPVGWVSGQEPLVAVRTELRYTAVGSVHKRSVFQLKRSAHVQYTDPVGPNRKPIASNLTNTAAHLRAGNFAVGHIHVYSNAFRERPDHLGL